jgi:hypothetical protein
MPAVVVDAQGEPVSYARRLSDVADPLPAGLTVVQVTRLPQPGVSRWDAASRAVVDLTPAEQAAADPSTPRRQLLQKAADKNASAAVRLDALVQLLGDVAGLQQP